MCRAFISHMQIKSVKKNLHHLFALQSQMQVDVKVLHVGNDLALKNERHLSKVNFALGFSIETD